MTTKLGISSEVQPDLQLRIREECGGLARVEGGCIVGPPELVIEIGDSTRAFDLGPKKADYERGGVLEYLFVGVEPEEIRWFLLRDGKFEPLFAGDDGVYRSQVFPGLWLDPVALFAEDLDGLIFRLDLGLDTPEHGAFVDRLALWKNREKHG